MPKFSFELDVTDSPDTVIAKMVDFSERRAEIWPSLSARIFKVHDLGPNSADVTEGSTVGKTVVWERLTYEWTDTEVHTVLTDGRIFRPGGTFSIRVKPHGTGSRVYVAYDRRSKTVLGRCIGGMMHLTRGAPVKWSFRKVYGVQR